MIRFQEIETIHEQDAVIFFIIHQAEVSRSKLDVWWNLYSVGLLSRFTDFNFPCFVGVNDSAGARYGWQKPNGSRACKER